MASTWVWSAKQARAQTAVLTVAAASDLKFALEALVPQFEKDTGHRIRLVWGSSGNLYTQILQAAPIDVFMSADEALVLKLAQAGKTHDQGQLYALGRLALLVPKGGVLEADGQLGDLRAALADGRLKRLAIANPEHAPYGQRAVEALKHAGLWAQLSGRLVLAENVAQAAQFALSGSTQGGIVAHALALAPVLQSRSAFGLIPESWHTPLAQRMVLMKNPGPAALAWRDFLFTPAALAIMKQFGFVLPTKG